MPNGYESPLNKLADALPNFILQMQDMKMRQEAQEALTDYRMTMLNRQIATETAERETKEALEVVRREMGYYEPPEVKVLRDNISYEMRTLNDPDIALTLGDEEITKRWKKLQNMKADYFGRTGRDISVSMPVGVEEALARIEVAKPPPAATPTRVARPPGPVEKVTVPEALAPVGRLIKKIGGLVKYAPGPYYPLLVKPGIEGAEAPTPAEAAVVGGAPVTIPEGARAVLTKEAGWVYTLDEKVWISVETGEPITGQ